MVEVEIRHIKKDQDEFRQEVRDEFKSVKSDVAEIKTLLEQGKGGWRTVVFMGTIISGAIAVLSTAWDWLLALLPSLPR